MKTTLHKTLLFLFVTMFALQGQAQNYWTKNAKYKIKAKDLDFFMTINASGDLEWAAGLSGNHESQVWTITDHRDPDAAAASFMEITATVGGTNYTMATTTDNISGKNITLIARVGDPVSGTGDRSGLDQFQRRKATNTSPPIGQNNALYIKVPGEDGSRYGVVPSAAGDLVKFDGGTVDELEFVFVEDLPTASVNTFGLDEFFIANPVLNNQLNIKGATSRVKQISVYSLTGTRVLSKTVKSLDGDINLDVNTLSTGLYILDMVGNNGERFTKKIIKQ